MMSIVPLAESMRPTRLKELVGQEHLVADGEIIKQIIDSKIPVSLILWGPPGSGKTTLARIIAKEIEADFVEISAVTTGIADVKEVLKRARENRRLGIKTLLFVDEIHRFNKAQQDAFLPHVESGLITLIGATTENPSFEVIPPLLSRSRVVVLHPLKNDEIVKILKRASRQLKVTKQVDKKTLDYIAKVSGGDARVALGNLELSLKISGTKKLSPEIVKKATQTKLPSYGKNGDKHFDFISAFIKSLRGSDANAALYYLARMLQAGEDPKFIARRMVIFASEDIGLASSPALNLAISTFLSVERVGMPECSFNLFHCAIVLAGSKKSRTVADAMSKAYKIAKEYSDLPVPLHLRNAPTEMMKKLKYGEDYKWQAGFKHKRGFLPPELQDLDLFK